MKQWLRRWLGITGLEARFTVQDGINLKFFPQFKADIAELRGHIETSQIAIAKLQLERYVPPEQQEPEKKVRIARTSKEFRDLTEREPTESEILDALR